MRKCLLLFIVLAGVASADASAAEQSRWRLGAAVGYGLRTNPLIQSDDIPIIVDLDIAWFGDHFFFDNGDLGLTFANNDTLTADIVGRFNSGRVFFDRTDTRFVAFDATGAPLSAAVEFEVPDRDYAIELGAELLTDGRWGLLHLAAFHDVSDTHGGYELVADYSFPWRNQRFFVQPSIGLSYISAAMNDYYFGVTQEEAAGVILPYEADAGINTHARLMFGYQLSKQWSLSLVAEVNRLNDEAAASPIVEEQDVLGYFAGVAFRF